jgi:alkylation response protein AidB-like acyl-CoA dehydrogenase
VDFAFTEEQEQLRGFAREFLAERYDDVAIARIADSDTGVDEDAWPKLVQMGWLDDALAFTDQAVLLEETGYRLLPAPFFSTVALAWPLLAQERQGTRATLAWAEEGVPQGLLDTGALSTRHSGGGLTGRKVLVPDAAATDLIFVVAADGDGPAIYRVETAAAGPVTHGTIDGTRRLATVELSGAPAERVASGGTALDVLNEIRDRSYTAAALEAVGITRRALDLLVDYAKTRQQFGRPIGVYQAISHKAADVYVRLQEAQSLAYWATWCVATGDPMTGQACLAAKSLAAEAAVFACEQAIQGHGGIGFTWEHVLHRYYKRAQWLAAFDGPPRDQRARLAAFLLD